MKKKYKLSINFETYIGRISLAEIASSFKRSKDMFLYNIE